MTQKQNVRNDISNFQSSNTESLVDMSNAVTALTTQTGYLGITGSSEDKFSSEGRFEKGMTLTHPTGSRTDFVSQPKTSKNINLEHMSSSSGTLEINTSTFRPYSYEVTVVQNSSESAPSTRSTVLNSWYENYKVSSFPISRSYEQQTLNSSIDEAYKKVSTHFENGKLIQVLHL